MPEYAYKCTECGHAFDVKKSFSEASRVEPCTECGCATQRVWSAPAFAGSGSGTGSASGSSSACVPSSSGGG